MSRTNLSASTRKHCWITNIGHKYKGKCFAGCNGDITVHDFECGHIQSVEEGGSNELSNLKPICGTCNKSMGKTNMVKYMNEKGLTPKWLPNTSKMNPRIYKLENCIALTVPVCNNLNIVGGFRILDLTNYGLTNYTYVIRKPENFDKYFTTPLNMNQVELYSMSNTINQIINAEIVNNNCIQYLNEFPSNIDQLSIPMTYEIICELISMYMIDSLSWFPNKISALICVNSVYPNLPISTVEYHGLKMICVAMGSLYVEYHRKENRYNFVESSEINIHDYINEYNSISNRLPNTSRPQNFAGNFMYDNPMFTHESLKSFMVANNIRVTEVFK